MLHLLKILKIKQILVHKTQKFVSFVKIYDSIFNTLYDFVYCFVQHMYKARRIKDGKRIFYNMTYNDI